ncbi:MAG: hypothetical protein HY721_05830, partial [Planctomycetes bacterium]|nr:hypothetical protein [Planctomycetota bacterium]
QAPAGGGSLEARVDAAVRRGREELLKRLDAVLKAAPADYPAGRIALPVAALLKAGAPSEELRVQAALARLAGAKVEKTYCAACYLFALDALLKARERELREAAPREAAPHGAAPHGAAPRGAQVAGSAPPGGSGEPAGDAGDADARTRGKIAELVRWLVSSRLPGHGSWTYEAADKRPRHDFSNTQFAVLGLQIGLEHGVEVPREAFLGIAALFSSAITRQGEVVDVAVTLETPLEARLGITKVSGLRRHRAAPGGWGYTDPRRGKGKGDDPYASMTAAGASSLVIALEALKQGRGARKDERKVLEESEKALHSAFAWIAARFDDFLAAGKNRLYALYSLEKLGDLGRIEKFGERDWYREGAEAILEAQRPNGSWGSYVDTSFALLFLTRATRLLDASPAPRIYTGGRGGGGAGGKEEGARGPASDLVYVERAKGFLSARALLEHIGEARRPELVPVAEEVVRNYSPDSREDLAAHLLALWRRPDRVTSFARRALTEVTGLKSSDRGAYAAWVERLEAVRALEADERLTAAALARELKGLESSRLKARLVTLAHRRGFKGLAEALVEEMSVPSVEYRRKLHGILSVWTGEPIAAPAGDDPAGWEATAQAWQDWWRTRPTGPTRPERPIEGAAGGAGAEAPE